MKVELEISDEFEGNPIYVFAGIKMVGVREPGKDFMTVSKDCTRCGKCCKDSGESWVFYDPEKGCKYLGETGGEYYCMLKAYRPFACSTNTPSASPFYCEVEFKNPQK